MNGIPESISSLPPITVLPDEDEQEQDEIEPAHSVDEPISPDGDTPENDGTGKSIEGKADATVTGDTPTDETPATPEADNDLAAKAKAFDDLTQTYTTDPTTLIKQLLGGLTEAQQKEFLGAVAPKPPEPAEDAWDDMTTKADFFVGEHREVIKSMPGFSRAVEQEFQAAGQHINSLAYQNAKLQAQIALLSMQAGFELPEEDEKAILVLAQGGDSYQDAFKKAYIPKAQAALKQKASKEAVIQPKTPRNGVGEDATPDVSSLKGKPLADYWKLVTMGKR